MRPEHRGQLTGTVPNAFETVITVKNIRICMFCPYQQSEQTWRAMMG
jgi:hypothetical protein